MQLVRFRHKGLRQLHEDGNAKGVPAAMADKLRKLLFALETAETLEQLSRFPGWKLHPLKGDLKGLWSLTITGNWRLIFRYDEQTNTASDIDLIDYHQEARNAHEESAPSGRPDQNRDRGGPRPQRVEGGGDFESAPRHAFRSSARQGRADAGNGAAHRKGVRPRHEPPSPHAARL